MPSLANRLPTGLHAVVVDGVAVVVAHERVEDEEDDDERDDDETVGQLGVVRDCEAEVDEVGDEHGEEGHVADGGSVVREARRRRTLQAMHAVCGVVRAVFCGNRRL